MSYESEKICRICLNWTDCDFYIVDESTKRILDTLSLKINLSISKESVICKNCIDALQKSFNLISTCQNTIDSLPGFNLDKIPDCKLCLFCMQAVRDGSYDLNQLEEDIVSLKDALSEYIFQLYVTASEEPILCKLCHESLQIYMNFSKQCAEVEKKIQVYCELGEIDAKEQMDLYSISLFTIAQENVPKKEEYLYEPEEIIEDKTSIVIKSYTDENHLPESTQYENLAPNKVHKCSECPFTTRNESYLVKHQKRHKEPFVTLSANIESHLCKTGQIWYPSTFDALQEDQHVLVHKVATEVTIHRCNICSFETKTTQSLNAHQKIHKKDLKPKIFKCKYCSHTSKKNGNLKQHMIIHKSMSEIQVFRCTHCGYEAKTKTNLKKHIFRIHTQKK